MAGLCGAGLGGSALPIAAAGAGRSMAGLCGAELGGSALPIAAGAVRSMTGLCGAGLGGSALPIAAGAVRSMAGLCGAGLGGSALPIAAAGAVRSMAGLCGAGLGGSALPIAAAGAGRSMAGLCGAGLGGSALPIAAGAVLRRCGAGGSGRSPWKPILLLLSPAFSTSCARCAKDRRRREKRAISERQLTRYFVDQRKVRVVGGQGGGGGHSFYSEPRKVFGGPDGGNGGDGGHVIFKVDQQMKSLSSVFPFYQGFHGERGGSKNCYGANGAHVYVKVPLGTLVKEDGKVVADLTQHGEEYIAAYGGAGGKGNRFFLSNENRAPTLFTPGEPGQERVLHLELKTTAHAGLVGFPNAGKSSLLRAISRAKPAVAAYPFTTLNPHVGIVHYQDYEQVAVADIPGLIRGAHQNRGLGTAFLRHIERCRFLLYVVDLSVPQPWTQLQDLKYELKAYEQGLSERPGVVIGNKLDLAQSRINLPLLRERVAERVIALSALTGDNLEELLLHLKELYDTYVKTEQSQGQNPIKW